MADCCSLIEFLHAFEHHSRAVDSAAACSSRSRRTGPSLCGSLTAFCDHSPMAVVDAVVLLSVVAALGFLVVPYAKLRIQGLGLGGNLDTLDFTALSVQTELDLNGNNFVGARNSVR
uniref:Leucine-rich repeat-containing N-terminal plant-type domain-containing protein n=1 Tax=Oryza meridionalis TaxID=40149 RepID=A0A0E0CWP4_9ORYZ